MTFVGHTLTGATLGVLSLPRGYPKRWQKSYLLIFGLLANIPDLPLKYWGHDRYEISHSLLVNGLMILSLAVFVSSWKDLKSKLGWGVLLSGSLAWLSHLLLDSFYNHGNGVAIFWPFSHGRLALPIPWFSVLESLPPPLTQTTLRIVLIELVCYGTLLLCAIGLRKVRVKKQV